MVTLSQVFGLVLIGACPALSAAACTPPFHSFQDTALHVMTLPEAAAATLLSADLVEDPDTPCGGLWVVELLTGDDDVALVMLDAQTLEQIKDPPAYFLALHERPDDGPDSADLRPMRTTVTGTPKNDLLEGEWSDDVSTGFAGRDTFLLTPGSDVITDFDPAEDVLDMANFAFGDFGFGTLRTFSGVQAAARLVQQDGDFGTQIDLDGDAGDWSVWLRGVRPDALTPDTVIFPSDTEPPHPPVFSAERQIELSDGSLVQLPGHPLEIAPADPVLLSGSDDALRLVRRLFYFDEDNF